MTRILLLTLALIGCSPEQECISLDIYSEGVYYFETASHFKIIPYETTSEETPD